MGLAIVYPDSVSILGQRRKLQEAPSKGAQGAEAFLL